MTLTRIGFLSVCTMLSAFSVLAAVEDNWGQWRGPLSTGAAPTADPPLKWSATDNIKWKVSIPGRGTGTPIIWGDQTFVQTAIPVAKKVADLPTAVPGPILAAQQQGERRGRPPGGGPPTNDAPTEEHQ